GLLLDRLDQHNIARNTIVLFLADHGSNHKGSLLKNRGTEVPCLIRWPNKIKPGTRCDELIQSTDFVPTWFDAAKATVPSGYRIDGVAMAPLFDDPTQPIRQSVYSEMGPARSIKTKDWNYIALRYSKEQIQAIRSDARSVKKLMGLSGGVSRARTRRGAFDLDQLYDLRADPDEKSNVAGDPANQSRLREMQRLLKQELAKFPRRPYGEFIPGGNAVPAADQQDLARQLRKIAARFK
ncbi:MAG: sulfatase-like hydrolase/transferase, partial [Planctomycetales bacterium]